MLRNKKSADKGAFLYYEFGGSGEIRTHEPFRAAGFQDRCIQPLCHASIVVLNGVGYYPFEAIASSLRLLIFAVICKTTARYSQ